MSQASANIQRMIDAEEAARGLILETSLALRDLVNDESWEAFWATVPEPSTNVTILAMIQAEIKRIDDFRNWQDDRELHAQLRRGG
jgi:hypothetical protein